jgi:hypothetical protein
LRVSPGAHRAPLPNISKRLLRNRELIADHLGLIDPQEIDAAIEDLASRLTHAWSFVRQVDRNLSIAKQRAELRLQAIYGGPAKMNDPHRCGPLLSKSIVTA